MRAPPQERWRTLQGELLEPTTVSRREVAADRNLSMEIAYARKRKQLTLQTAAHHSLKHSPPRHTLFSKLDLPQDVRDLFKAQSADFGLQSSVAAMNAIASRLAQPVDAMSKRRAAKIASDPVTAEDLDMMAEAAQDALQAELRRHDRLLAEQLESEEAVEAAASRVVKEVAHVTLPPNAPVPRDAAVLPKELGTKAREGPVVKHDLNDRGVHGHRSHHTTPAEQPGVVAGQAWLCRPGGVHSGVRGGAEAHRSLQQQGHCAACAWPLAQHQPTGPRQPAPPAQRPCTHCRPSFPALCHERAGRTAQCLRRCHTPNRVSATKSVW